MKNNILILYLVVISLVIPIFSGCVQNPEDNKTKEVYNKTYEYSSGQINPETENLIDDLCKKINSNLIDITVLMVDQPELSNEINILINASNVALDKMAADPYSSATLESLKKANKDLEDYITSHK